MQTQEDINRATQVVREVIVRWDPYKLLAEGCPEDEFDREIASLVALVPRIRSRNDAIHALSRIFSSSFEPEKFSTEQCIVPGTELFDVLIAHSLISD